MNRKTATKKNIMIMEIQILSFLTKDNPIEKLKDLKVLKLPVRNILYYKNKENILIIKKRIFKVLKYYNNQEFPKDNLIEKIKIYLSMTVMMKMKVLIGKIKDFL